MPSDLLTRDLSGALTAAGSQDWAIQQAKAMLYFEGEAGRAAEAVAGAFEKLVATRKREGALTFRITPKAVLKYQARLRKGLSAAEREAASIVGASPLDIRNYRQRRIEASPDVISGDLLQSIQAAVLGLRELSKVLSKFGMLTDDHNTGKEHGSFSRIGDSRLVIPVRNPLDVPALVELRTRRIDVPPDWVIAVTPAELHLAPGAESSVVVNVRAASPILAGTTPRVSLEGYVGQRLISGVVLDIFVPNLRRRHS